MKRMPETDIQSIIVLKKKISYKTIIKSLSYIMNKIMQTEYNCHRENIRRFVLPLR